MTQHRTREERARTWITRLANAPMPLNLLEWGDFSNMVLGHAIAADTASAACADLQAENERLREALALVAGYVGGVASPDATTDFLCLIPEEVRLKVAALSAIPTSGRTDRDRLDWLEGEAAHLGDLNISIGMYADGSFGAVSLNDAEGRDSLRAAIDAAMDREGRGDG